MKTAEEVVMLAQEVGICASLLTFIGMADALKEVLGKPIQVQLVLADPARTTTVVSTDLLMEVLQSRAQDLVLALEKNDINTGEMVKNLESEINKKKAMFVAQNPS